RQEDTALLAKHLKIPLNKALKKYTIPDPDKPGVLDFKHIKPCKFYDPAAKGCKLYSARPWSCRIFPFLGIYGSEDRVKVNESCPGSVETMKALTAAMEEARNERLSPGAYSYEEIRAAKVALRSALENV
ncbi:MAG: YkgJ family cysteine cluster protein, partial [Methanothrix sp.]